jgi:RNA polymerase sigma-70 factor (ECF subfamily)
MMKAENSESRFQTTLWSVVLHAGGDDALQKQAALDRLCRVYWKPLFVFCLGNGRKAEDAEDMTQAFFAWIMARDTLRVADPNKGRFRAFLLAVFKNFIADEWDRSRAIRRGGGAVHLSFEFDFRNSGLSAPSDECSPEHAYDRQWALDLVVRASHILRAEYAVMGKEQWFDRVAGPSSGETYLVIAAELGCTEDAVKSFAKRARRRFRQILECEIADTVGSPDEVADELAYLVELLRG